MHLLIRALWLDFTHLAACWLACYFHHYFMLQGLQKTSSTDASRRRFKANGQSLSSSKVSKKKKDRPNSCVALWVIQLPAKDILQMSVSVVKEAANAVLVLLRPSAVQYLYSLYLCILDSVHAVRQCSYICLFKSFMD